MNDKLTVLSKIAREMNSRSLLWAVGGSAMLYFRGLSQCFRDVDLLIEVRQATMAQDALLALGATQKKMDKSDGCFYSGFFCSYEWNGLDIDLIGDFGIIKDGVLHTYPLHSFDIDATALLGNAEVPLHRAELWKELYTLMDRPQRVADITRGPLCERPYPLLTTAKRQPEQQK
ncbi:MAG: hypothetical protein PHI98_08940 [Eubacteriales bacterium]|nr:hypothetical protein [Eubacteriales bacterium]